MKLTAELKKSIKEYVEWNYYVSSGYSGINGGYAKISNVRIKPTKEGVIGY